MTGATRRNIWFPDDLWKRIEAAAAQEGAKRGKPVSVAEWVRTACEEKLERGS
jgi:hypothetical protein